jgi:Tol biopolymer transport system component
MEPFLSPDGRTLFFNNSNDPAVDTNLHWAERVDDATFQYRGLLSGANTGSLDAVPSMDAAGTFCFVSTRSYDQTQSTLYRGSYQAGTLAGVELIPGLAASAPGLVILDAFLSPDGNSIWFAEGDYSSGHLTTSKLWLALRSGGAFARSPDSGAILQQVNLPGGTQYAPALTASGLELFFTRLEGAQSTSIYRASRANAASAFGPPVRIASITGFAEAPTLSADGKTMYFHKLENNRFVIYRVTRP